MVLMPRNLTGPSPAITLVWAKHTGFTRKRSQARYSPLLRPHLYHPPHLLLLHPLQGEQLLVWCVRRSLADDQKAASVHPNLKRVSTCGCVFLSPLYG